jgi:hypothetical protein
MNKIISFLLLVFIFCITNVGLSQTVSRQQTLDRANTDSLYSKGDSAIYLGGKFNWLKIHYVSNRDSLSVSVIVNGMIVRDSTAGDSLFYRLNGSWVNISGGVSSLGMLASAFKDSIRNIDSANTRTARVTDKLILGNSGTDTVASASKLQKDMADTSKDVVNDSLNNSQSVVNKVLKSYVKYQGLQGLASVDSVRFTNVYDNNLYVTMPACTVSFGDTIKTYISRICTLIANSHNLLWVHKDSGNVVTVSTTNPIESGVTNTRKLVFVGHFITADKHVALYLPPTEANYRWLKTEDYIDRIHGVLILSGLTVSQGGTGTKKIRRSEGEIFDGIDYASSDSLLSSDTCFSGDYRLRIHWGTSVSDTISYASEIPVDSVWNASLGTKVAMVSNKWYKGLAYFIGKYHMDFQLPLSTSESNTAAMALTKDAPTITASQGEDAVPLYWVVYQQGAVNLNSATFTDVRKMHGTASGSGGVTDHGLLTGLGDNDHIQYTLNTAVDDSAARVVNDSLNNSTSITNKLLRNAVDDSVFALLGNKYYSYYDSMRYFGVDSTLLYQLSSIPKDSLVYLSADASWRDLSGRGNNGTATNVTIKSDTIASGFFSSSFNGTSSKVDIGNPFGSGDSLTAFAGATNLASGGITVGGWFKLRGTVGQILMGDFHDATFRGWDIENNATNGISMIVARTGGNYRSVSMTTKADTTVWLFIVGKMYTDGTYPKLFVNDVEYSTAVGAGSGSSIYLGSDNTKIGVASNAEGTWYSGLGDLIFMYKRILSSTELQIIKERTNPNPAITKALVKADSLNTRIIHVNGDTVLNATKVRSLISTAIKDSGTAHWSIGRVRFIPEYPNVSFKILSADTSINCIVKTTSLDTIAYTFSTTKATLDSLAIYVGFPIPSDFLSFADSAIVIRYDGDNTTNTNNYIRTTVIRFPNTVVIDSTNLASASWTSIMIPSTSITGSWSDGDILWLKLTIGVKTGYIIRTKEIFMKYNRK